MYTPFRAGGNMNGDVDHNSEPVEEGAVYIMEGDPWDGAKIVAGPFDTMEEAQAWADCYRNGWVW